MLVVEIDYFAKLPEEPISNQEASKLAEALLESVIARHEGLWNFTSINLGFDYN